jgi:guanine deaminase
MAKAAMTVIRGGRVLDIRGHAAPQADILVKGDTIAEIGKPGMAAPSDAKVVDARNRLLHPGLINGHTHSHGNLGKGLVDNVTLELLLTAGSWMNGQRTLEDKYLSSLIGAAEMVLKGCTAAYDLSGEFPMPTVEGLQAIGQAYADVGMRAVLAPMVADGSLQGHPRNHEEGDARLEAGRQGRKPRRGADHSAPLLAGIPACLSQALPGLRHRPAHARR